MKKPKEHTGSFFLEPPLLEILDMVAHIEGQSRGVIVERAIRYLLQGDKDGWNKTKASTYHKGPKKVHAKATHHHPFKSQSTPRTSQSKRYPPRKRFKGPRSLPKGEPVYPSLFKQECLLRGSKGL